MLKVPTDRSVDRIVGGAYINITLVPYMLSLMLRGQHMCGGGIINENWAITTAHCIAPFTNRINELGVRSGSSYIDEGGVVHDVSNFTIHENYDPDTNNYDIAVIRVEPPFEYNNETQPLIVAKDDSTPKHIGLVAGWGYFLAFDPVLSRKLQYVYLPKVDRPICKADYMGLYEITKTQVCYGFRGGGQDSCKGDSGGPMINIDNILIGLTSWGDGCAEPAHPGVYTDAVLLRDWIEKKTANGS